MLEIKAGILIFLNAIHCCDIYADENEMAVPKEGTLECGEVLKCFLNIAGTINNHECCEDFLPSFHAINDEHFFVKSEKDSIPHSCNKTISEQSYKNILLNLKKNCEPRGGRFIFEDRWDNIFKECPNIEKYYEEEALTDNKVIRDMVNLEAQGYPENDFLPDSVKVDMYKSETGIWPIALGFFSLLSLFGIGYFLYKKYWKREQEEVELQNLNVNIFLADEKLDHFEI